MFYRLLLPFCGFLAFALIASADTTVSVGVDDWDANNSSTNVNHMFINVSGADGIDLIMGGSLATGNQAGRASSVGRDGYGTGTSDFGFSGNPWFDGSYLKFGNVSNQNCMFLIFPLTQLIIRASFDIASRLCDTCEPNLRRVLTVSTFATPIAMCIASDFPGKPSSGKPFLGIR